MKKFQFERHIPKADGTIEIIVLAKNLTEKEAAKAQKKMANVKTSNNHTFHIAEEK